MDLPLACPSAKNHLNTHKRALARLVIGRYKALSFFEAGWGRTGFRPIYALWAEGTVAGGTPWMDASDVDHLFNEYMNDDDDDPEDTWYGGYWTAHMRNESVWVDPEYVVDRMVNHGFVALQAQLCAGGCLDFIADLLTLNLHTAFKYFWPTWVESGIPTATTDQIPVLAKVTEAMLGLTGCICSIDLPLVFQKAWKLHLEAPATYGLRGQQRTGRGWSYRCDAPQDGDEGGCTVKYSPGTSLESDGHCDDGGPGAEFNQCPLGTDCEDCGVRQRPSWVSPFSSSEKPKVTFKVVSEAAYSGAMDAFCEKGGCADAVGTVLDLFIPAIALALPVPGLLLRGDFSVQGALLATDPPVMSAGTFTEAQLHTVANSLTACACSHFKSLTGESNLFNLATRIIDKYGKRELDTDTGGWAFLQPPLREAKSDLKYCSSSSCRAIVQVLNEWVAAMENGLPSGVCTAANVATCLPANGIIPPDAVCTAPTFGSKVSQKFPMRWFDLGAFYPSGPPTELSDVTDHTVYWEMCSAMTDCPVDGPARYRLRTAFQVAGTVDTFDALAFKRGYVAFLNNGSDAGTITASDIDLKLTSGSVQVEALVTVYSATQRRALLTAASIATPATLQAAIGVGIESISPTSVEVDQADGTTTFTSADGGQLPYPPPPPYPALPPKSIVAIRASPSPSPPPPPQPLIINGSSAALGASKGAPSSGLPSGLAWGVTLGILLPVITTIGIGIFFLFKWTRRDAAQPKNPSTVAIQSPAQESATIEDQEAV